MQVVGLTGFAGAGKSTVAEYLVKEHGFTRLSFAAPLKKMLRTLDPMLSYTLPFGGTKEEATESALRLSEAIDLYEGDEVAIKESGWGPEYRRLLQVLGTDCIRAVDEDFWVNAAASQMDDQDRNYVFDDVRFPNEAFVISGITPLGLWYIERNAVHRANGHASEQHAGKMGEQVHLFNGGRGDESLKFLFDQVDNAVDMAFGQVTV